MGGVAELVLGPRGVVPHLANEHGYDDSGNKRSSGIESQALKRIGSDTPFYSGIVFIRLLVATGGISGAVPLECFNRCAGPGCGRLTRWGSGPCKLDCSPVHGSFRSNANYSMDNCCGPSRKIPGHKAST